MKSIINGILMMLAITPTSFSQALYSPSGNSASVVRHINTPVNLYTGLPSISVPLYSLPGRSGQVPVALSYHAAGLKVDDVPSDVGMGWSLIAGGAVTRVVRDLPDEDTPHGYLSGSSTGALISGSTFVNNFNSGSATNATDFENFATDEAYDTEPDMFYFSFPGASGKFYLDQSGHPVLVPHRDIKIEPAIGPQSVGNWVITTTSGTKYYFGENASSRETTVTEVSERTHSGAFVRYDPTDPFTQTLYGTPTVKSYISTWHLNRIVDHNGRELFSFAYGPHSEVDNSISTEVTENIVPNAGAAPVQRTHIQTLTRNRHTPKALQTITSPDLGSVSFSYDGNDWLTSIQVFHGSTLRMQYDLEYTGQGLSTAYQEDDRHFLDRIIQRSTGSESDIVFRSFTYNMSITLPYRGHPAVDHWGYFNDYSGPNTRVASYVCEGYEYGNSSANKEPSNTRSQAGILQRIDLPSGGYETFSYELNETWDGKRGGLRIGKKTVHDGIDPANDIATYYSYETSSSVATSKGSIVPTYHSSPYLDRIISVSGQSLNALQDLGGVSVGYEVVTESRLNNGKTVYRYQGFHGLPDIDPAYMVITGNNVVAVEDRTVSNLFEVSSKTSRFWQRGLLKSRSIYDNDNNLLSITTNNYTSIDVGNNPLYGLTARLTFNNNVPYYDVVMYQINSEGYVLESTESVVYDQKSKGLGLTTTISHTYDPSYLRIKESQTTNSDGEVLIAKTTYLKDYNIPASSTGAAAAMKALQDRGLNIPIERFQYVRKPGQADKVTGGSITTFSLSSGKVYPYQNFAIETNVPLANVTPSQISGNNLIYDSHYGTPLVTFNSYDAFGNVLSQTGADDITTTYTYRSDNVLVESVTVNAGSPTAKSITYEHLPMIGISKETDPNGRSMEYRYDGFNRLRLVLDHEGNIANKYEYEVVNTQP